MYEIRKFAITFSRKISQNTKRSQCELEKKLKELESNLNSEANFNEYKKCKKDLEVIYERKSQLSFFLITKRKRPTKASVRKLEVNGKDICNQAKINDEIKIFYEEAFKCHNGKSFTNLSKILNSIDLLCLTNKQKDFCEIELGEK